MKAEISIIMPVLNGAEYISEAIKSVFAQSFQNLELIVVDAGSTDGTIEIVEKFGAGNMRLKLIHSEKKSMGHQYNIGIEAACGKYIGFVESDDYIQSDRMFEVLYEKIEEFNLDYIKANHSMFVELSEGREFLEIEQGKRLLQGKDLYNKVICPADEPYILLYDANHWKGIYSAEFIKRNHIKFNTTPAAAFQDVGFIQQTLVCAERCMYIDEFFYCYRRDNLGCSTLSPKGIKYAYDEFVYVLNSINACKNKDVFLEAVYKRAFMMFFAQMEKIPNYDNCSEEIKDAIVNYLKVLEQGENYGFIMAKDYSVERWNEYCVAKSNQVVFARFYYYKMQYLNALYKQFIEKIKGLKDVVQCGYGEMGKAWWCFFKCNGVNNIKAVCDNNKSIQGKKISEGIELSDVEITVRKYPESHYFIAVGGVFAKQIKEQLIKCGISESQIVEALIPMNPYRATTIYE